MNHILATTFSRALVVEHMLQRPVNWIAYAALKLKGQCNQWRQDGKAQPNGPLCIRNPPKHFPLVSSLVLHCPPQLVGVPI